MRHWSSGVAIVSAIDQKEELHAMTATSVVSVSVDPPLLLVSLNSASRTLHAIETTDSFAVSIMTGDQAAISDDFATSGVRSWQSFQPADGSGLPILVGALATLECTAIDYKDVADHTLVIGAVDAALIAQDEAHPLLRYNGAYLVT